MHELHISGYSMVFSGLELLLVQGCYTNSYDPGLGPQGNEVMGSSGRSVTWSESCFAITFLRVAFVLFCFGY